MCVGKAGTWRWNRTGQSEIAGAAC